MKQPILVQPLEIRSIWYYTATESHLSADKFSMFTSTHHWHTCRTCKSSQDQWKTARNTSAATLLRSNCTYNLRLQWYKMFQRRLESKNKQGNVNAGCDNVHGMSRLRMQPMPDCTVYVCPHFSSSETPQKGT